jgi:hypothetical protein
MWTYVVAGLTVPLSYLLFGSPLCADNECKFGQGGVQCISIFLFWLCCANTVKSFPTALPPKRDDDEDGYNGEEDDDDLYYETEEDMWNDRRPPKPQDQYDEEDEDEDDDGGMVPYYSDGPYATGPRYGDPGQGEGGDGRPDDGYYYDRRDGDGYDRSPDGAAAAGPSPYSDRDPYDDREAYSDHGSVSSSRRRPPPPLRVGDVDGPTIT